jgi:Na+/H+ antiporter NhaD/arsenite permease-like protein
LVGTVFFFFFSFSPTYKALIVGFMLLLLKKKKKKEEGLAEDYLKQAGKERAPFSLLTCLVLCQLGFFLLGVSSRRESL